MNITVTKLTDKSLVDRACSFTTGSSIEVKSLYKMYKSEHSPIRTQLFWIEMEDIPTFVSVHLVRHKIGVEHFVKSNRVDRGGEENAGREAPVNHSMLINAQALINMARKRLCTQASLETRLVMQEIKTKLYEVDVALFRCLLPECQYRGGFCYEFKCCGQCPKGD